MMMGIRYYIDSETSMLYFIPPYGMDIDGQGGVFLSQQQHGERAFPVLYTQPFL
jgi:hypothetical protein